MKSEKKKNQTCSAQANTEINTIKINSIPHRWSQKILPKHNRYIEQRPIGQNKEYKVNYLRRISSYASLAPKKPEISAYMHISGGQWNPYKMKRRENENNTPSQTLVKSKSNASHKQQKKWEIKHQT